MDRSSGNVCGSTMLVSGVARSAERPYLYVSRQMKRDRPMGATKGQGWFIIDHGGPSGGDEQSTLRVVKEPGMCVPVEGNSTTKGGLCS